MVRIMATFGLIVLLAAGCGGSTQGTVVSGSTATARPDPTSTPSGPRAVVEPDSGPPGTQVTVRGSGWEPGVLIDLTAELGPGVTAAPYETVLTGPDGSFTAMFRLEAAPDGGALVTGRFNLIARSPAGEVRIPFRVETRRPVGSSGPSG